MKKKSTFANKLLFAILLTMTSIAVATAQVKIGDNPTAITASSVLELEGADKAFRLTRVALTGLDDVATVPSPVNGMMVFNTATAGTGANQVVENNTYVFNGTSWAILSSNAGEANNASNFAIGEVRYFSASVIRTALSATTTPRARMSNGSGTVTGTTTKTAVSDLAGTAGFIVFHGLRMDYLGYNGSYVTPVFYNTLSSTQTYWITGNSTVNAYTGGMQTISANAYNYRCDADDIVYCTTTLDEFTDIVITFTDGQWYKLTYFPTHDGTNSVFYFTAQRLQ